MLSLVEDVEMLERALTLVHHVFRDSSTHQSNPLEEPGLRNTLKEPSWYSCSLHTSPRILCTCKVRVLMKWPNPLSPRPYDRSIHVHNAGPSRFALCISLLCHASSPPTASDKPSPRQQSISRPEINSPLPISKMLASFRPRPLTFPAGPISPITS